MRREANRKVAPGQPALVVLAGQTRNKRRPLDQDVFVIGRAPGCDLGLVAAEVAPVHCLILRLPDGWRIRDCTGRGATRVNGQAIRHGRLRDGDVIQVGSFSFSASLPAGPAGRPAARLADGSPEADRLTLERSERSRRNFARHALRLRDRLAAGGDAAAALDERQADLEHQEERLRNRARDQERKAAKLVEERAELDELRAELDRKRGEVILKRVAEADALELEAQVRELERWGVELTRQHNALDRRAVELDRRASELNHYARSLLRARRRPAVAEPAPREDAARQPEEVRPESLAAGAPEDTLHESDPDVILPPAGADCDVLGEDSPGAHGEGGSSGDLTGVGAGSAAANPQSLCEPSQNGLTAD